MLPGRKSCSCIPADPRVGKLGNSPSSQPPDPSSHKRMQKEKAGKTLLCPRTALFFSLSSARPGRLSSRTCLICLFCSIQASLSGDLRDTGSSSSALKTARISTSDLHPLFGDLNFCLLLPRFKAWTALALLTHRSRISPTAIHVSTRISGSLSCPPDLLPRRPTAIASLFSPSLASRS